MKQPLRASLIIAGIVAVSGTAAAAAPSAEEVVSKAISAVGGGSALADHDMIRLAIHQEETTSDAKTQSTHSTAIVHGGRFENARMEIGGGISLMLSGSTGAAMIRGQVDTRPQTPIMAAGTIRQTIFPLLLPYSLQMDGVRLGSVSDGSFDGTPVWILEVDFEPNFFAAPSMVTTWNVFIRREDGKVLATDHLPSHQFRDALDEGMRFRYLKRQNLNGIEFAAQVLVDGIDFNGVENGHVRVTKIKASNGGPFDLSLFIEPSRGEQLDAGEIR